MKKLIKVLYLLPLSLLFIAGCSKKINTTKENKTTSNITTKENKTTLAKTTTERTTTEKKYSVLVNLDKEDAATITGIGSFSLNSNTTITITTNEGYDYIGLYDGSVELTKETTYEITNITKDITLTAKFSAKTYALSCTVEDDTLGSIENVDGNYECGSTITLKANAITGYELEGWYVDGTFYNNEATTTYKIQAKDSNIVAKFKIQVLKLTITDNLKNTGKYYVDGELYKKVLEYEYGTEIELEIIDLEHYHFDYFKINNETCDESYYGFEIEEDINIVVNYEINEYYLSLSYDSEKIVSNYCFVKPTNDDLYTSEGYISGYYAYNTEISIDVKIKTTYSFVGLYYDEYDYDTYESVRHYVGKSSVNGSITTIKFKITNEMNLYLELEGKTCTLNITCDEVCGRVEGSGEYHYGDEITIKVYPNKGYKFSKWVLPNGTQLDGYSTNSSYYGDYWYVYYDVKGNASFKAVFETCEYKIRYYGVTDKKVEYLTEFSNHYLDDSTMYAYRFKGYTFAGWLKSEDINSLYSTKTSYDYTMTNEDINVYAYYTPNEYTITFNFNGGTGTILSQKVTYDSSYTVEIPTLENYAFNGYYDYFPGFELTCDSESILLFNFLNNNGYRMSDFYDRIKVNGTIITEAESHDYLVKKDDIVSVEAFGTSKHAVNSEGKSTGVYDIEGDAYFVANWGAKVTYLDDDGSVYAEDIREINDKAYNITCDTVRTGYTFKYWSYNNEEFDFNKKITQNITLEAYYEANEYDLKVRCSNGIKGITINGSYYEYTKTVKVKYKGTAKISLVLEDGFTLCFYNISTYSEYVNVDPLDPLKPLEFEMPYENVEIIPQAMSYVLYISVNEKTYGSIDKTSIFYNVAHDETFSVTASPNTGYAFLGWYDEDSNEFLTDGSEPEFIFRPTDYDDDFDYTIGESFVLNLKAVFGSIKTNTYERLGNKIWFGYYPQTCLNPNYQSGSNSALVDQLKAISGADSSKENYDLPTLDTYDNYIATKDKTSWIPYSDYVF